MISVRFGTWETNSSSAHALIYTTKDLWTDFINDKLVLQLGPWGVPKSFRHDNHDGVLLTWEEARNVYVEWLNTDKHFGSEYVDYLKYNIREDIKSPNDITIEDFKQAVEFFPNSYSHLVFGTWFNYHQWSKARHDEYGNLVESKAVIKGDNVELDFWWFAG